MRITRNKLRQIIQEELGRLNEQDSRVIKVAVNPDKPATDFLDGVIGQVKITYSEGNLEKESPCYDIGQELNDAWKKVYTRSSSDLIKSPKIVHCETGMDLVQTALEYVEYYED